MSTAVDIVPAGRMSYNVDMGYHHNSMAAGLEAEQYKTIRHTCYRCSKKRYEKFMFLVKFIHNQHWLCDWCFEKYGEVEVLQKPALWRYHIDK